MMSYIVSLREVKARGRNVRIEGTSMAGDFIISLKPCEKTSTREYIVNSVPHSAFTSAITLVQVPTE